MRMDPLGMSALTARRPRRALTYCSLSGPPQGAEQRLTAVVAELAAHVDPPGERVSRARVEPAGLRLPALGALQADAVRLQVHVRDLERRDRRPRSLDLLAVRQRDLLLGAKNFSASANARRVAPDLLASSLASSSSSVQQSMRSSSSHSRRTVRCLSPRSPPERRAHYPMRSDNYPSVTLWLVTRTRADGRYLLQALRGAHIEEVAIMISCPEPAVLSAQPAGARPARPRSLTVPVGVIVPDGAGGAAR